MDNAATGEKASPTSARVDALHRALAPYIPRLLRRFRVPERDSDDVAQDVQLTIFRQALEDLPAGHSAGNTDIFIARFDPSGNYLWARRFGDAEEQRLTTLRMDNDGNLLLLGAFAGTIDFDGHSLNSSSNGETFVAKLDGTGKHLWSHRWGDMHGGGSAAFDEAGNAIMVGSIDRLGAGELTPTLPNPARMFAVRFDLDGNPTWSKRFGEGGSLYRWRAVVDASGHLILTGHFQETVDLGTGPLTTSRMTRFLMKLGPLSQ